MLPMLSNDIHLNPGPVQSKKVKVKKVELCSDCNRVVKDLDKAIQCDDCNIWIHASCNSLSDAEYLELIDSYNDW